MCPSLHLGCHETGGACSRMGPSSNQGALYALTVMNSHRWSWGRRALVAVGATFAAVILIAGSTYLAIQHDGNLHAVEPGVFYRSAQLSADGFHQVIQDRHIKTVLNLRGPNAGRDWYDSEIQAVHADGVVHLDYALSAVHELTPTQVSTVLEMVRTAQKPILVHCNAGADRTGLVSALYQLSRGKDVAVADEQLSLRYGHFPYLGSRSVAMDKTFSAYTASAAAAAGSSPVSTSHSSPSQPTP